MAAHLLVRSSEPALFDSLHDRGSCSSSVGSHLRHRWEVHLRRAWVSRWRTLRTEKHKGVQQRSAAISSLAGSAERMDATYTMIIPPGCCWCGSMNCWSGGEGSVKKAPGGGAAVFGNWRDRAIPACSSANDVTDRSLICRS